jgi:hypothetical protein
MACVLVLAACGWHGTVAGVSLGAEPALTANPADRSLVDDHAAEDEELPDLNYLQVQAEAGRAKSQTRLADYLLAVGDLTNAVVWYRRAADQGDAPAQLSLAGCLMTGRGTAKNPTEAAQLLRRAADAIEWSATNRLPRAAAGMPGGVRPSSGAESAPGQAAQEKSGVRSPGQLVAQGEGRAPKNVPEPDTNRLAAPSPKAAPPTSPDRVERVNSLLAPAPALQEARPVLRPASDPRPLP